MGLRFDEMTSKYGESAEMVFPRKDPIHLPDSFFDLCKTVYSDYPGYIPEDRQHIRQLFDPAEHDLLRHADVWVGLEDNKARLVATRHPDYGDGVVYFGYWETVADFDINKKLFSEMETWAKSRGANTIVGPIDFTTANRYRLLHNRFDSNNFQNEPFNPPYYVDYCEKLGFSLYETYFTDLIRVERVEGQVFTEPAVQRYMNNFLKSKILIHPLTSEFFLDHAHEIVDLLFNALRTNVAIMRSSHKDYDLLWNQKMARWLCPFTSLYATDRHGRIIGCIFIMPDYGELLRQCAMNRISIADINHSEHFKLLQRPRALVKTVGVDPVYKNTPLFYALCDKAFPRLRALYFDVAIALTSNNSNLKLGGMDQRAKYREYGLYRKSITR